MNLGKHKTTDDDNDNETDSHLYFIGTKHPDFTDFPFEDGSVVLDPFVTYPRGRESKSYT